MERVAKEDVTLSGHVQRVETCLLNSIRSLEVATGLYLVDDANI